MAEQQPLTVRAASLLLSKGRPKSPQSGGLEERLQALLKKAQEVGYEDAVEIPQEDLQEAPEPIPVRLERRSMELTHLGRGPKQRPFPESQTGTGPEGPVTSRLKQAFNDSSRTGSVGCLGITSDNVCPALVLNSSTVENPPETLQEKSQSPKVVKKTASAAEEDCMYCKLVCGNLPDPAFCKENFKKLDRKEITQDELETLMASKFGPKWEDDVFKALEKKGFKVVG